LATLYLCASDVYKPHSLYVGDCSLENHDVGLFLCCLCRYVCQLVGRKHTLLSPSSFHTVQILEIQMLIYSYRCNYNPLHLRSEESFFRIYISCSYSYFSCHFMGSESTLTMLYAFFWVIPRRLKFICRRFGTLCLFHLHR